MWDCLYKFFIILHLPLFLINGMIVVQVYIYKKSVKLKLQKRHHVVFDSSSIKFAHDNKDLYI